MQKLERSLRDSKDLEKFFSSGIRRESAFEVPECLTLDGITLPVGEPGSLPDFEDLGATDIFCGIPSWSLCAPNYRRRVVVADMTAKAREVAGRGARRPRLRDLEEARAEDGR